MDRQGTSTKTIVVFAILVIAGCAREEPAEVEPGLPFPEFPWPPPQASATADVGLALLRAEPNQALSFGDVADTLSSALDACEYFEKSYYRVPGGFAMVTRLEQINSDGTCKEPPDRWCAEVQPLRKFSLRAYLRALFTANTGFYRIIVFIVTPTRLTQEDEQVSRDEAMKWLRAGANKLPDSLVQQPCTDECRCTALIYEFAQPHPGAEAELKEQSALQGRTHLQRSGIWHALEG